ncbi:MAG: two-component sensor histidine kinase [Magnetovibrio sp.]|nr:two-component sensor histidine kinase [Magnetovibrio sp.]|tara:strand:+ start:1707 stop:3026 length:1320 start_codon:yes stop_codon:yes gene_type:complete
MPLQTTIKNALPKSLLGRALLIIVTPLILLQVVSGLIFYETHWDKVSYRLARSVAGDVAAIVQLVTDDPSEEGRERAAALAGRNMDMFVTFLPGAILSNKAAPPTNDLEEVLDRSMQSFIVKPYRLDSESSDRNVSIDVQLADGVLRITTTRKRLFSTTVYVFVIWMIGTSLILFGVATIFMRNQVKPIRRLARAADNFGKGRDVSNFKPEGATEVRQAAQAFMAMRERIQRQITQRTDMLSGVSHDLRTPLTRMKLQLAMFKNVDGVDDLSADVSEMEHMLEGYLAFARGEGTEKPAPTDLGMLLEDVVGQVRRRGRPIDLHLEDQLNLPLRPNAFKRCVTNLVENAARYGQHVSVRAGHRGDAIEITVDDDGPGIPEDKRAEVFRPFFRLDDSRNPETGGVGLGLTIARDVVRSHGGEILLSESPAGGLRGRIRLPL